MGRYAVFPWTLSLLECVLPIILQVNPRSSPPSATLALDPILNIPRRHIHEPVPPLILGVQTIARRAVRSHLVALPPIERLQLAHRDREDARLPVHAAQVRLRLLQEAHEIVHVGAGAEAVGLIDASAGLDEVVDVNVEAAPAGHGSRIHTRGAILVAPGGVALGFGFCVRIHDVHAFGGAVPPFAVVAGVLLPLGAVARNVGNVDDEGSLSSPGGLEELSGEVGFHDALKTAFAFLVGGDEGGAGESTVGHDVDNLGRLMLEGPDRFNKS